MKGFIYCISNPQMPGNNTNKKYNIVDYDLTDEENLE